MTPFLDHFERTFAPDLDFRADGFRRVFEHLEANERSFYTFVETGVAHLADADGRPAGYSAHCHSTLLFDAFLQFHDGLLLSVDHDPEHCRVAREWVSPRVRVFCHDSRAFLADLDPPGRIDCLFLDSLNVDWDRPHEAALHHLEELCAILPRLVEGCIVFVDDAVRRGGKPGYIDDLMERLEAETLFDGHQMAWRLTSPPRSVRPLGHFDAQELAFLLERPEPRLYRYVRRGLDERILELLPDGMVGWGRASCEERWYPERGEDGVTRCVLVGNGRITARLEPAGDGWRGRWRINDRPEVELVPLDRNSGAGIAGRHVLVSGDGAQPVELLLSRDVAWGKGRNGETWHLTGDGAGLGALLLCAAGRTVHRLERDELGTWRSESASLHRIDGVTEGERRARAAISSQRWFHFARCGDGGWTIELLPDGVVGRGAPSAEVWWDVEEDALGEIGLVLYASEGLTVRLVPTSDGAYAGTWPLDEQPAVRVEPLSLGGGAYQMPLFATCIPRGAIHRIVEVGSGNGADAVALHRFYGAEVMTFECSSVVLDQCREAVAPYPRIQLFEHAVGDREGPVAFHEVATGNVCASSCFVANPAYPYERYVQQEAEVEMIRLDRWLASRGIGSIDLLAVDAQGATFEILQGMGDHLDQVRFLIAEIETRPVYEGETLASTVTGFLQARGFVLLREIDQWGVLPDGRRVGEPFFDPRYAGTESWFGDYLFYRPTAAEDEVMREVVSRRHYRYERVGHDARNLELLPDGRIGAGGGGCEQSWMILDEGDGPSLHLLALEHPCCRLARGRDGRWVGRWLLHERMPVLLEPIAGD